MLGAAGFAKALERVRQFAVAVIDERAGHGLQSELLRQRTPCVVDDFEVDRHVAQEPVGIGALRLNPHRPINRALATICFLSVLIFSAQLVAKHQGALYLVDRASNPLPWIRLKFALIGLTKVWAKELGPRGVTVNAVCPGWVKTDQAVGDMERLAKEKGVPVEKLYKEICEPLELRRFTEPEEVANLVGFLVSPEGSGVTGRDWLMNTVWNQT